MKKKISIIAAIAVVTIVAVYIYMQQHISLRYNYEPGKEYLYRVELLSENDSLVIIGNNNAQPVNSMLHLKMKMHLTAVKKRENNYILGIHFSDIEDHRFVVLGTDLLPDRQTADAVLTGRQGFVQVTSQGEIKDFMFAEGELPLFKQVVLMAVKESALTLQDKKSWSVPEETQHGSCIAGYTVSTGLFKNIPLNRKRAEFALTALSGRAVFDEAAASAEALFSKKGYLYAMKSSEKINASDNSGSRYKALTTSSFQLIHETKAPAALPADDFFKKLRAISMREIMGGENARQQINENRASGLTMPDLTAWLDSYGERQEKMAQKEKNIMLWRASGLVRLNPALADELAAIFLKQETDSAEKLFILSILSAADIPESQKAMIAVLGNDIVKSDKIYYDYLQAFSFVSHPIRETGDFLLALINDDATSTVNRAAAYYPLGSVIQEMAATGDVENAKMLNNHLVQKLAAAETVIEKKGVIAGIGNAAMKENIPLLEKFVADNDDRVRAEVATALRKTQTEQSEKMLVSLAGDNEANVQKAAYKSMYGYQLNDKLSASIVDEIKAGRPETTSYGDILNIIQNNITNRDFAEKSVQEMLKHKEKINSAELESRMNSILRSLQEN